MWTNSRCGRASDPTVGIALICRVGIKALLGLKRWIFPRPDLCSAQNDSGNSVAVGWGERSEPQLWNDGWRGRRGLRRARGRDAPAANPQATNHAVHPRVETPQSVTTGLSGSTAVGASLSTVSSSTTNRCACERTRSGASSTAGTGDGVAAGACRRGWWPLWRGDAPTAVASAG